MEPTLQEDSNPAPLIEDQLLEQQPAEEEANDVREWDFTGQELIEDESESVIQNRISILEKTREATHQEAGGGCLLANNLNKQIQRRLSQLESFSGPSREVSVIRCISTPNSSLRQICSFNFEESEEELQAAPTPTVPQFQIFLDNPREYYSLTPQPEDIESVFEEETEESSETSLEVEILPLFHDMSAFEDEEAVDEMNQGDRRELIDGVDPDSEVRRRVLRELTAFKTVLRSYDPQRHSSAVLVRNKEKWTDEVKEKSENVINALVQIELEEELLQSQSDEVTVMINSMQELHMEYVQKFEEKCDQALPPAAAQPAGVAPGLRVPPPGGLLGPGVSPSLSIASTVSEQTQAKRAQNYVNVEKDDIKEEVKALHSEFSKVQNWSEAADDEVELEMTKIKGWRETVKKLKERLRTMKVKILDFDLAIESCQSDTVGLI